MERGKNDADPSSRKMAGGKYIGTRGKKTGNGILAGETAMKFKYQGKLAKTTSKDRN